MTARIDMVWLGSAAPSPAWPLGSVSRVAATPPHVSEFIASSVPRSTAEAWLFWDSTLAPPSAARVAELLSRPGDIWHAGLTLGLSGAPDVIDFIAPTWPFTRDPAPDIAATSWRVTLRACLARTAVLRWTFPRPDFDTLEGASLEWGHRCIMYGALPRHAPSLVAVGERAEPPSITLADQFRFARARFGIAWAGWAAARAALTGYAGFEDIADAWLASRNSPSTAPPNPYSSPSAERRAPSAAVSVSVIIPTIDRYPHLRTILNQLRAQSVRPTEILVVDQTPAARCDPTLATDFADLPLTVIVLNTAGQCTARNLALGQATGDHFLFLDDDDEIQPDLIARHLEHLVSTGADVSSGVAHEPASGPLPAAFQLSRASDVFPTNNTLIHRSVLTGSGMFDLAYDHGARADGDLGMRVYLSGAVMLLNPSIAVLHHHAPRGGLRAHGARLTTYQSSRNAIGRRHLPEATEHYRALRYFSARQVHEATVQSVFGTLSIRGGPVRKGLKMVFGILAMPDTLFRISRELAKAREMLTRYPQIPTMSSRGR